MLLRKFTVVILPLLLAACAMADVPPVPTADLAAQLVGDDATDNQAALQHALDAAAAAHQPLVLPAGVFRHSGPLNLNGVTLQGQGASTILHATTRNKAAVVLKGEGAALRDLTIRFIGTTRSDNPYSSGVLVQQAKGFTVHNVAIEGGDGTGIIVRLSSNGTITGNTVAGTLADAIHVTAASHDISITGNTTYYAGDDGIAVVSYETDHARVQNITVENNRVLDNRFARGLTVVGGNHVTLRNNVVRCTLPFAGIYLASEPSYRTYGVDDITVTGNTVTACGGGALNQGAIMLFRGYRDNSDIRIINNTLLNIPGNAIEVRGIGNHNVAITGNTINTAQGAGVLLNIIDQPVTLSNNTTTNVSGSLVLAHSQPRLAVTQPAQ